MELQQMSRGIHPDRSDPHGRGSAFPSSLSAGALPLFLIQTADNGAGDAGNGYFADGLIDRSHVGFEPFNAAETATMPMPPRSS
jgi:hypothetical protein